MNRWAVGILSACCLIQVSQAWSAGFTVSGATVTLAAPVIVTLDGNITLSSGQLITNGAALLLTGDWTRGSGDFVPGTSTVPFPGPSASTSPLAGSTTFYALRCITAGKSLSFQAGSTQTVTQVLTLTGTSGNLLSVLSTV